MAVDLGRFDYVLLLDIIEHLTHPEAFLDDLRAGVAAGQPPPKLVVTSGNVGFCIVRGCSSCWGTSTTASAASWT